MRLLQPLLYYRAQSQPQTKQNNQTQLCQTAMTPHWDVSRCQDRLTLYYCMLGHSPQPAMDPVKPEKHSDNPQSRVYMVVYKKS